MPPILANAIVYGATAFFASSGVYHYFGIGAQLVALLFFGLGGFVIGLNTKGRYE